MGVNEITPFRMSKPFKEHMPDVLDAMASDPNGLYQVTYRVGPVMVSAQIWVDPACGQPPQEQLSEFDREFLKQIRVVVDGSPEEIARP
jgi:hypothetical protein